MQTQAATPPSGFIDLMKASQQSPGTFVKLIGVVVDMMPPKIMANSGQHMLTFKLLDRELSASASSEGFICRYFKQKADELPQVKTIGDVVLVRDIKINVWNGQTLAMANFSTSTVVFPAGDIPSPAFAISFRGRDRIRRLGAPRDIESVNLAEQEYVIHLKSAMQTQTELSASKRAQAEFNASKRDLPPAKKQKLSNSTAPSYFGPKLKSISELEERQFADICGIVVKRVAAMYGTENGCDLYITDYTENIALRSYAPPEEEEEESTRHERDGDIYGYSGTAKKMWPGPWGHLVLKVNVKQPHAQHANSVVKEGDVVLLRNVKTRITPVSAWLEGDMWPYDRDPQRVGITKINASNMSLPEVQSLLQRQTEYWSTRNAKLAKNQSNVQKVSNKNARKKQRKQQKKEALEGIAAQTSAATNPHVRCSHEEVVLSRVRDILDPARHINETPGGTTYPLPFWNARYRVRVRVVDYEPKELEDFSVPAEPVDERDGSQDSMAWQYNSPAREWYFSLLLEDASEGASGDRDGHRIWVHLQHEQAQFLLGNDMDDPEDLRHNASMLSKLREKMFLLWGNLEETKREETRGGEGLSNKPFECCIQEYGVELDNDDPAKRPGNEWLRLYSMFGTTIL